MASQVPAAAGKAAAIYAEPLFRKLGTGASAKFNFGRELFVATVLGVAGGLTWKVSGCTGAQAW
jgi:hypothetical protein